MTKIHKPISSSEYDGNFIREVDPIYRGKRRDRMVELKCIVCNNLFTTSYDNSKRIRQKSCSNQCKGVLIRNNKNYVAQKHPLYSVWTSMHDRCVNKNNKRYVRYGERGITFDSKFDSFDYFLNTVSALENYPYSTSTKVNKQISLDRIDCNGNYKEGNLRWVNNNIQAANKTWKKPNSTSKYIGVNYCATNKAWVSKLQFKGKTHNTYYGQSEEEAYLARKNYILENNLPNIY